MDLDTSTTAISLMDSVDHGSSASTEQADFHMEEEPKRQNSMMKIANNAFDDVLSYISEYGLLNYSPDVKEKRAELSAAINSNDVVIVAKEGCGFCERAKAMLADEQEIIYKTHHYWNRSCVATCCWSFSQLGRPHISPAHHPGSVRGRV